MKKLYILILALMLNISAYASDTVTGFWTTIDDETKSPKSVVQIYEYQGKIYGRVVDILTDKTAKAQIKGNPPIIGLDIIWDLTKTGDKYKDGSILDPKKGKVYGCELWRDGDNLIVRGKIAFIGRNQTWLKNTTFKPTTSELPTPHIPELD